jgi:2-dehydropantoate 2-reductase
MRYVIIGAGAIGGVLGARLAQHDSAHPPLLVARGEHGAAIARAGLRLRTPDEDVTLRVDSAAGPDGVTLRPDDVLVLTTKTQQAQYALEQWVDAPVTGEDGLSLGTASELLPILVATNGVESERLALRLFSRVYGVCVWLPAVQLDPGEVILRIAHSSGTFIVGRYGAPADSADRELLATVAAEWSAATFTMHIVEDVMRWKYAKLLSNLGNAVQALVGADESFESIVQRLRVEAEGVYRVAGIEWATAAEEAEWRGDGFDIRPVPGAPELLGGSSWQSLARGTGSIETDYLNGEIALLARANGTRASLNETVQRLARHAARDRVGLASLTVGELEAMLV